MSNKRRKSLGSAKLKRNLMIRIARGCERRKAPWPGDGRQYRAPEGWILAPSVERRRDELQDTMRDLVHSYYRGE